MQVSDLAADLDETLAMMPTLAFLENERRMGWRKSPLEREKWQPGSDEIIAACHAISKHDFERAMHFAHAALSVKHPAAHEVTALALYCAGKYPEALRAMNALLSAGTCTVNIIGPAGQVNAAIGDFRLGMKLMAVSSRMQRPQWSAPAWEGEPLTGKAILVMSGAPPSITNGEMGYGDEVMLARFAPDLARLGADVYLKCSPQMAPLLASLEGSTPVLGLPPKVDYIVDPLELPHLLQISSREKLPQPPYLMPPRPRPAVDRRSFNVGISWGCGLFAGPQTRWATLSELRELADVPGITLYSLEKGPHAEQLQPPPEGMRAVVDLGRGFQDFADSAAAIDAMDLIVSTDNVVANIAGALGKPLFVLGDYYLDWRFTGANGTTPWYPTARVFRQEKPGAWRPVVAQVATEIRRLVARRALLNRAAFTPRAA